jgi:hypothetical protein
MSQPVLQLIGSQCSTERLFPSWLVDTCSSQRWIAAQSRSTRTYLRSYVDVLPVPAAGFITRQFLGRRLRSLSLLHRTSVPPNLLWATISGVSSRPRGTAAAAYLLTQPLGQNIAQTNCTLNGNTGSRRSTLNTETAKQIQPNCTPKASLAELPTHTCRPNRQGRTGSSPSGLFQVRRRFDPTPQYETLRPASLAEA